MHPFSDEPRGANGNLPPVWARRAWKVFLNCDEDVFRAIEYANGNPEKEGKLRQTWSFVVPYMGVR